MESLSLSLERSSKEHWRDRALIAEEKLSQLSERLKAYREKGEPMPTHKEIQEIIGV